MNRLTASSSLHLRYNASYITTRDGIRFSIISTPFRQIIEIPEYWTGDICEDEHILDIGGNIGAFCIRAAKKSSHVSAVEPFTTDILNTNINLNGVDIKVFCGALGDGFPTHIEWDVVSSSVSTYRLSDLI